jgi:hypothetical protein
LELILLSRNVSIEQGHLEMEINKHLHFKGEKQSVYDTSRDHFTKEKHFGFSLWMRHLFLGLINVLLNLKFQQKLQLASSVCWLIESFCSAKNYWSQSNIAEIVLLKKIHLTF